MRLLVIGASGQLARALADLDQRGPGPSIVTRGRPGLDVENPGNIAGVIDHVRPDIVVNAAGYTSVDAAETDRARAFAVNADGAGMLAAATAARHLPLIHISTDYVFSGEEGRPYREDDPPLPHTAYGRSKLGGEIAVAGANPDHVIVRTAWLYGSHGSNFVKTMLRLAKSRDTIEVVADQSGNPTYTPDLAEAILVIATRMLATPNDPQLRGVVHLAGPESATWCDFAREIMLLSAGLGGPAAGIAPIASSDYPAAADRPRDSRLDSGKARDVFGIELPRRLESLSKCLSLLMP